MTKTVEVKEGVVIEGQAHWLRREFVGCPDITGEANVVRRKLDDNEGRPYVEDYYGGDDWYSDTFTGKRVRSTCHGVQRIEYFKDGKLHREDGPASQVIWDNGRGVVEEEWRLNGKLGRLDGNPVCVDSTLRGSYRYFGADGQPIEPARPAIHPTAAKLTND